MKYFRLAVIPLLLSSLCYPQDGKIFVVNSGTKELKRTAHRLQIQAGQLKNARQALDEATDTAKRLDSLPMSESIRLAQLWVEINLPKAAVAIEGMLDPVRRSALAADGLEPYRQAADMARNLISTLAQVDADKALQIVGQWPASPLSAGEEGGKVRRDLQKQCRAQIIRQLSWRHPQRALALAEEMGSDSPALFAARAGQIQSMTRLGQKEQALELADRWAADYKPDNTIARDYLIFLRTLADLDPDRFLAALAPLAGSFASGVPNSPAYYVGDKGIPITPMDSMILGMLRQRPELLLKAVDMIPGLKAKAEQAGGIDNLITGRHSGRPPQIGPPGVPGGGAPRPSRENMPPRENIDMLLEELIGKAEKDPGYVRARLSEIARDPRQIDMLITLADTAGWEDPELGSMVLDAARPLLAKLQPPESRIAPFEGIARGYRNCDGEANADFLREGFLLVAQLRDQDETSRAAGTSSQSQADVLESFLLSELARENFEASMNYVRGMPDKLQRTKSFLGIAQTLREAGMN